MIFLGKMWDNCWKVLLVLILFGPIPFIIWLDLHFNFKEAMPLIIMLVIFIDILLLIGFNKCHDDYLYKSRYDR